MRERQPGPSSSSPAARRASAARAAASTSSRASPAAWRNVEPGPRTATARASVARSLGQPRELAFDDAPDLLGAERPEPRGGLVVRGGAVGDELGEQGPEQKRIAAGDGMARVGEPGARLRQALAHQCLRRDRTEGARPDGRLGCTGQELLQQLGCRGRLA